MSTNQSRVLESLTDPTLNTIKSLTITNGQSTQQVRMAQEIADPVESH
jgi:hypothetical protein